MAREEPIGLDVKDESLRSALDPPLCVLNRRDAVIAAIDLDNGEL